MEMAIDERDNFQYEYFSSVRHKNVEWLWYPYIPYGKLTILQGDPGEGKSTFMLAIAAMLTKGRNMPDGSTISEPQRVIYQTAEDNISDTVKPRLVRAGADCNKVAYIVDEDASLTLEDSRIEEVLKQTGARLFILDPLQAYLSQDSDMMLAGRMRQQLKKLADIAAKYECAMVIIGHMNKASSEKSLYRGLGSIDIAAIARSVLMISHDKDRPEVRIVTPIKSSLAPKGPPIAFCFDKVKGISWLSGAAVKPTVSTNEKHENKHEQASRIIIDMLDGTDIPGNEIVKKLNLMGISERTVRAVKKELAILSYKKDNTWFWHFSGKGAVKGDN